MGEVCFSTQIVFPPHPTTTVVAVAIDSILVSQAFVSSVDDSHVSPHTALKKYAMLQSTIVIITLYK